VLLVLEEVQEGLADVGDGEFASGHGRPAEPFIIGFGTSSLLESQGKSLTRRKEPTLVGP
jgi:hypothetical protein